MPSPPARFDTIDAFDAWAETAPGRWELHDGRPVPLPPERAAHVRLKARAWQVLDRALAGTDYETLADGLVVAGPGLHRFRPDVVVTADRPAPDAQLVAQPVILLEALSPATEDADAGLKLDVYFALPTLLHYLIVSTRSRRIIHHRRWEDSGLLTTIHRDGSFKLDPPGLSLSVEELYRGTI